MDQNIPLKTNLLTLFFLAALLLDFDPREAERLSRFSIAAVGDINLGGRVTSVMKRSGYGYPWEKTRPVLSQSDITFGNLECAISDQGFPVTGKEYTFRGPKASVPAMKEAGLDIVSLANNHSLDFGQIGLKDTVETLDSAGIGHAGAGRDAGAASQLQIVEVKGRKIGFLAFSGVVPPGWEATSSRGGIASAKNLLLVSEQIKTAKSQSDVLIVSFHWGKELETYPNAWQRKLAHLAIDSGAVLVIGHHPHVVQGIERYQAGVIAYSLGNFVFSPGDNVARSSVIMTFEFKRDRINEICIYPVYINGCQPQSMDQPADQKWLEEIGRRCQGLGTEMIIEGEQGKVVCEQEKSPLRSGAFFWRR